MRRITRLLVNIPQLRVVSYNQMTDGQGIERIHKTRNAMYVSILENNNNKTDMQTYYVIMSDVLILKIFFFFKNTKESLCL